MPDKLGPRDLAILALFDEGEKLLPAEVHKRLRRAGSRWVGRSSSGVTATLDRLYRLGLVGYERQAWAPRLWWITTQGLKEVDAACRLN